MLLGDVNSVSEIFDDAEIDAFLDMGTAEVLLAAAFGAEAIASSELYVQKVIKIMDLQTDGAKTAAEWRAKAKQWRDLHAMGEADEGFDWAELAYDPFSSRERVRAQALRE